MCAIVSPFHPWGFAPVAKNVAHFLKDQAEPFSETNTFTVASGSCAGGHILPARLVDKFLILDNEDPQFELPDRANLRAQSEVRTSNSSAALTSRAEP